jgi:phospholipase C
VWASWDTEFVTKLVSRVTRPAAALTGLAALLMILGGIPPARAAPANGIHNIKHVVMIMQENRSFDSYFGTYPGANGIPAGVCVPDPTNGGCVAPVHDSKDRDNGGPHGGTAAVGDIDGGRMDGFVSQVEGGGRCNGTNPNCTACAGAKSAGTKDCLDVMDYHDAREIPNYWTYAQDFVLQDNLFESAASWSLPEHNFLVSGWSAFCPPGDSNPLDCVSRNQDNETRKPRPWTDVTFLLHKAQVSWRYYVFEGSEPDCEDDEAITCSPVHQSSKTPGIWNPLADFTDVKQDGEQGNIQSLNNFFDSVHETSNCGLPNVSWIVPNHGVSEHPPASIANGQAYVTTLINSIMRSPCWGSTAIFLSWDDWGGFYDHVVPPTIDQLGYGLRVPGLVISPYAKTGYIDHQQLSHDAYLKFIEDDFLGKARLDPATDGRPDARPDVREEAPGLGDIANDFNFKQAPRAPVLLPTRPEPGPASEPPGSVPKLAVLGPASASNISQTAATLSGSVNPSGSSVSDCHFDYGTSTAYEASVPCEPWPGAGTSPVSVTAQLQGLTAGSTYHFRLVATNAGGEALGPDQNFPTPPEPPVLAGVEPDAGLDGGGTPVTISGTNFTDVRAVDFGPSAATSVTVNSPTSISAVAPPGTGTVDVTVTNSGGTSTPVPTDRFTYVAAGPPPTVSRVTPPEGPPGGGTIVSISGKHFAGVTSVEFGAVAASSFTVSSASSISAVSPPDAPGPVDVTVITANGTSAPSARDRFTFEAEMLATAISGGSAGVAPLAGGA